MANLGIADIENFASKIRFALMVIPPVQIMEAAKDQFDQSLTSVTLNAWKTGKNQPSRSKLKLLSTILNIEWTDFYLDFDTFAELVCRTNSISLKKRAIFKKRVNDIRVGSMQLKAFSRYDGAYLERLFNKIQGRYFLYNYSMSNIPRINVALVHINNLHAPFIGVTLQSLRDGQYFHYNGTLFAVRSNIQIILETEYVHHDEVVVIATNNPVDTAREVHFLHGVILSGSEDFISYPSAARVFMEKLPSTCSQERSLEIMAAMETAKLPEQFKKLINNDLTQENGEYVLRAEQLNAAYLEMLKQVSSTMKYDKN